MDDFNLAHELERKFRAFGYHPPVDSDDFRRSPVSAIEDGLQYLEGIGALSHEEFTEHLQNFKWEDRPLAKALEDDEAKESIEALLRNLDDWNNRYLSKLEEN